MHDIELNKQISQSIQQWEPDYWVEIVECDRIHIESVEDAIFDILGYERGEIPFFRENNLVGVSWRCETYSQAQALIDRIRKAGVEAILTDELGNHLSEP